MLNKIIFTTVLTFGVLGFAGTHGGGVSELKAGGTVAPNAYAVKLLGQQNENYLFSFAITQEGKVSTKHFVMSADDIVKSESMMAAMNQSGWVLLK